MRAEPKRPNGRIATLLLLSGLGTAAPLGAQVALFPDVTAFEFPAAYPRPAALSGRLLSVGRGESRYGAEREAEATVGEVVPVLALAQGAIPVTLGLGLGVTARFSLDDPRSALVSADWLVAIHTTVDLDRWRLDLALQHESSHLGDEYAERFDASRLDWTREVATLWAERRAGAFSFHAQASYTLIDELDLPRGAAGLGIDYRGPSGHLLGSTFRPVIGLYAEAAAYGDWTVSTSARAGAEAGARGRAVAVSLVYFNGLSTQRQFFDRKSRYYGIELRFDF